MKEIRNEALIDTPQLPEFFKSNQDSDKNSPIMDSFNTERKNPSSYGNSLSDKNYREG
jgi:hypothetical protein